ncbi:Glycosyl hydrolases family 43 [Pseudobutyrivibrio sp. ACV-2]|uniref:family 43 glycosylhydrolase n=1 Tax=Pseudobutyrivibrio sp. ACV-2 TaxID=1520801 RepID=UPI00089943BD|nr:family 43 glycosylhydrolase [Pseudobutyrivibrio sp. ACV-2]SEA87675.1 Glycosyl hydrolases family 43 [Pseudobutyrivibrio sp. ACV-2]
MEQIFNPYLPLTEYVPDGEPHVFDGRVYIYGSHDKAQGKVYCEQDYVTWSAPVDNLKDWKYEGVIYRKEQDPSNADKKMQLWAPDVTKGPDGRYYLYYCYSFYPEIGVAVSDSPAGPFEFYGHVKYPKSLYEGKTLDDHMPFDPAVLTDDDGRVYLYWGFAPACEKEMILPDFSDEEIAQMPPEKQDMMKTIKKIKFVVDSQVAELEPDMLTLKEEPRKLIPSGKTSEGTGFEGHGFFEASSIRKINGKYYFVYSSHKSHELCYAISDKPDRDFVYGGIIISNGNIGLDGNEKPTYTLSNNHGGIEKIGDNYYIFYHRCTDGNEFSRQGCAEKITIEDDGTIKQVEMTSCGLNGGALVASGMYPAGIACHITSATTMSFIDFNNPVMQKQTRMVERQNTTYITNIEDGTTVGYKYFDFDNVKEVLLEVCGEFGGVIELSGDFDLKEKYASSRINIDSDNWQLVSIPVEISAKNKALYISFTGNGSLDLKSIGFR